MLDNYYKASGFETIGHLKTCKSDSARLGVYKKSPCVAAGANGGWMRGLCVPFKMIRRRSMGKSLVSAHAPSFRRTISLIVRPSAPFPAMRLITAFITRPISFADVAPASRIDSSTARSISAGSTGGGK